MPVEQPVINARVTGPPSIDGGTVLNPSPNWKPKPRTFPSARFDAYAVANDPVAAVVVSERFGARRRSQLRVAVPRRRAVRCVLQDLRLAYRFGCVALRRVRRQRAEDHDAPRLDRNLDGSGPIAPALLTDRRRPMRQRAVAM